MYLNDTKMSYNMHIYSEKAIEIIWSSNRSCDFNYMYGGVNYIKFDLEQILLQHLRRDREIFI